MRGLLQYIFVYVTAVCIGTIGVLHGISGGSMALLLGVHNQLVFAIRAIDREAFMLLKQKKIPAFWSRINGNYLTVFFAGIITGLLVFRSLFAAFYAEYPVLIASFFFSLVALAALLLLRKVTRWTPGIFVSICAGLVLAYAITRIPPLATSDHLLFSFLTGIPTGFTFILPGVSGAFVLMLLGKYQFILTGFTTLEFDIIILFIAGSILGLTVMARITASLLSHYFDVTVALVAGLMIGSLNKIWPWREVIEYATTRNGKRIPAFDQSILPWHYLEATGKDPHVFYAVLMMASGVLIVVIIEKIAARLKTKF